MRYSNTPKKILCVRLDNMGDIIMTTPAFRALKQTFLHSFITLLTSTNGSFITPFIPSIDETITYDAPWTKQEKAGNFLELVGEIRQKYFDSAIIFTNFSQSPFPAAMLCYLAHIPSRIAYCRENPYKLLTYWIPDTKSFSKIEHGVKRQLDLVAALGAYTSNTKLTLTTKAKDYKSVISLLSKKNINIKHPFICIHPGASEEKRRLSPDFFANIAKAFIEQNFQVVLTGIREETHLLYYIHRFCAGKAIILDTLTTGQLISLISSSALLLSNNTGPVHIAAATQTPIIVFYARTNPEHTPWQVPHKAFYFTIPKKLQSKNVLLQKVSHPPTQPFTLADVLEAAHSLLTEKRRHIFRPNSPLSI